MVPELSSAKEFFVILGYFLPFYPPPPPLPPINAENQNFENMKNTPGDIILHTHTKNQNHMMYDS